MLEEAKLNVLSGQTSNFLRGWGKSLHPPLGVHRNYTVIKFTSIQVANQAAIMDCIVMYDALHKRRMPSAKVWICLVYLFPEECKQAFVLQTRGYLLVSFQVSGDAAFSANTQLNISPSIADKELFDAGLTAVLPVVDINFTTP